MTLDEIGLKYNTDKCSMDHNYLIHYQNYIGHLNPKKLLEMGIYQGASLKLWYDYFPETQILGIDLHDYTHLNNDRTQTMAANCELRTVDEFDNSVINPWLQKLYNDFPGGRVGLNEIIERHGSSWDIILDDGPHTQRSNQVMLGYLFPQVKSGGIYIIEDLHTSYGPTDVYNSYPYTDKNTLWMLQNYQQTGQVHSDFITRDEIQFLEANIKEVFIERGKNSEIAFIIKK